MDFDTLVSRLAGDGPVQPRPDGTLVCCPVHGDKHPSLLVTLTAERSVLVHCRSHGCAPEAVLRAVRLTWHDLYDVAGVPHTAAVAGRSPLVGAGEIAALRQYLDRAQAAWPGSPAAGYARERFGIDEQLGTRLGLGFAPAGDPGFEYTTAAYTACDRLVVPFFGPDGVARGVQARDVTGQHAVRWAGLRNPDAARWASLAWFGQPDGDGPLVVAEGPGDAVTAFAAGFSAVGVRGAVQARRDEVAAEILAAAGGRVIVLAGDADTSGSGFNAELGRRLAEADASVAVLALPEGVNDLADWYRRRPETFSAELIAAVAAARVWQDNHAAEAESGSSPPAVFDGDPETLLDEIAEFLQRYLYIRDTTWFTVITAWIASTYCIRLAESADVAPRLGFVSSVPGAGKSLALDLTCRLSGGRLVTDPTAASVLRTLAGMDYAEDDPDKPLPPVPLGIDETDNLYSGRSQDTASITSVLNSGYRRGNEVTRADTNNQHKAIAYETFAPVVWAGLAKASLPDALLSRTFLVEMHRATPEERPESFRPRRHGQYADALAEQLAAWTRQAVNEDGVSDALDEAETQLAAQVANRDLELWSALMLPALLAGPRWSDRVRHACRELKDTNADQAEPTSVRFLRATREVYRTGQWGRGINNRVVFRGVLAAKVMETDALFERWSRGRGMDDEHVRSLLREFGVRPRPVRVSGETGRGFRWADLMPEWDRYLGEDDEQEIAE